MDHDKELGREVKRLRTERGWSQTRLAIEADMSVSGLSMIENGHRNLSTATLTRLAAALGVEVRDLFPLAQPPLPEPPPVAETLGLLEARAGLLSAEAYVVDPERVVAELRRRGKSEEVVQETLAVLEASRVAS